MTSIQQGGKSPGTWSQASFLPEDLRSPVANAEILLVPGEGYAEHHDLRYFPSGTIDFLNFLKEHAPETRIEICAADDDYREVLRHADILYLANVVLEHVALPVLIHLVMKYVEHRRAHRKELPHVHMNVTIHDAKTDRAVTLDYEGASTAFEKEALNALHALTTPQPKHPPKSIRPGPPTARKLPAARRQRRPAKRPR